MKNRYDQLIPLIRAAAPKILVEVGVHRAMRSTLMCHTALRESHQISFVGYDVFETKDQAFHARALNGKGIPSQQVAERRMREMVLEYPAGSVKWKFVIGDTQDTLHKNPIVCDFAFVDGDHRVEMIRGDAAGLSCPCIVFDDYYTPGPDGKLTDLSKYGANAVVDEYAAAGCQVEVLPKQDMTKEGCYASLAVVRR